MRSREITSSIGGPSMRGGSRRSQNSLQMKKASSAPSVSRANGCSKLLKEAAPLVLPEELLNPLVNRNDMNVKAETFGVAKAAKVNSLGF